MAKLKKATKPKTKKVEKTTPPETMSLIVVAGVEGPSVYLNNFRIAGPKPWGGGKTIYKFSTQTEDVILALKGVGG